MRKIVLYIAASIDNCIARENGSVDWLDDPQYGMTGEDFGYHEFYRSIDTTLMGNKTYRFIEDMDIPFPYPEKTNFVLSRSKKHEDNDSVKYIRQDPIEFIEKLKRLNGKDIWLLGGGQINTLLLNHGLIDKIILTIIPRILGKGIKLFEGTGIESQFQLKDSKSYKNGFVQLCWEKK
jgi:dihydrofolate reductase